MSVFAPAIPYAYLISGFAVLYFGAEWLVGASARLAVRFGVKPLLVGVTIVAMGTSAPEFVVSVMAAHNGIESIAIGNVVGSNICNTALVLGLSALICPILVSRQFFKFDIPVLIGASFLGWYFLRDGSIQRWEGIVILALFAGYMAYNIANAKIGGGDDDVNEVVGDGKKISVVKNTLLVLLGLGMLMGGANLLVKGSVEIATSFGMSKAVIGLTIVAFGTSLPELATSVVAAVRKHNDIAIGNVVGSNLFNILCILGVVGAMGADGDNDARGVKFIDLMFMSLINFVLLMPLITKNVLNRWIGGLLTGSYAAYILMLAFHIF